MAIGIRSDGGKEILDYSIAPNENGEAWNELLQGLKERGITDIQLFIADGMVGLQNAIFSNFPQAKFQRCWVHVARTQKLHFKEKEKEKRYNLNMQKDRSKSYEEKNNFNINNTVG